MIQTAPVDILFLHVPKFKNWYRPIDHFSFILYHPIGLLGLADYSRQNGFSSRIIDLGIEQKKNNPIDYNALIAKHSPLLIAMTLHWHFQAFDAIECARAIKRMAPGTRIVLGGFTASFFADEIMREYPEVDYIIRGDAEIPIVGLIRHLKGTGEISTIPNLLYRANESVVSNPQTFCADQALINRINYSDFSFIESRAEFVSGLKAWVRVKDISHNLHKAMLGAKSLYPVYLGRGCPYVCSYCGGNSHAQRTINNRAGIILRSVENVVQSLVDIHCQGFDGASFNYDPLAPQKADDFYRAVFAKLRDLGIKMFVEIERWKLPSEEFIVSFKETFAPGSFVSLSLNHPDEPLRIKNNLFMYSNENLEACLGIFERHQVNVMLFFACGLPFETSETLRTLNVFVNGIIKRYRYVRCKVSLIEIEPCSDLSISPEKYKITVTKKSFMDYYRYHADQRTNHYQEIGYSGDGILNKKNLTRFYCSHFCKIFKAGRFSPLFCRIIGLAWKIGIVRLIDKTIISRKKSARATANN